jgi:hypothetical protein
MRFLCHYMRHGYDMAMRRTQRRPVVTLNCPGTQYKLKDSAVVRSASCCSQNISRAYIAMLFITYTSTSSTAPLSMSSIFSTKSSQTACTSASSHTSLSVMSGDRDALNESNPNQIMAHDQQHDSLLSAVGSWAWALDTSPSGLPEFDDDRRSDRSIA